MRIGTVAHMPGTEVEVRIDYARPDGRDAEPPAFFHAIRSTAAPFVETERAGHAQLRFVLDGAVSYCFADGRIEPAARFHILGPSTRPRLLRGDGTIRLFGIEIGPCGWAGLVGSDAATLADGIADAEAVLGKRVAAAATPLRATTDVAAMAETATALIDALAVPIDPHRRRFVRRVDRWLSARGSPDMATLLIATGRSRRQIERNCNRLYGAPPKLLARRHRALRAAAALVDDRDLFDDVMDLGFYDQSHLIREIKAFTGLTPRQLKADPGPMAMLAARLARQSCDETLGLPSGRRRCFDNVGIAPPPELAAR